MAHNESGRAYLVIEAGGRTLALATEAVREVVFRCALHRPPTAPPLLAGLLAVAGEAVPVVALATLLDLTETPPDLYAQIVLLDTPAGTLGLGVDRARASVRGADAHLTPVATGASFADCVVSELVWTGGRAALLALDRLLLESERQVLAHFRDVEAARLAALGDTAAQVAAS